MNFYVVNRHFFDDKEYAYGEQVDQKTGDFEKCDICGSAISMRKWLTPLKAKLSKPSYGDFVFGTFTTFLVTERFKKEYEANRLTGIVSFEPVEIVKVNRERDSSPEIPIYYYVSIVRSKSVIDERKSKIQRDGQISCNHCRTGGVIKSLKGIFFEDNTWSGEDIFFPIDLPGTIMVSERFTDFIKNYKFSNISFISAEEYIPSWAKLQKSQQ
jgi:hypothetical protein